MKLAAATLTLAHCAARLTEAGVSGPRLDLFIPATDQPGATQLVVIHQFLARLPLGPAPIEMTIWAQRPSPTNRHRSLGDPILLN